MKVENPFKPKAHKEAEAVRQDAEAKLKEAEIIARACFNTAQFQSYREAYKKAEASVIDFMLRYNSMFFNDQNGDMNKYAFTMMRFLTKLQTLKSLLETVESNALKGNEK
jgi:hypothetical protein